MVITDGIHLAADSLKELHAFAERIGMRRSWFHAHPRHPHYDILSDTMLARAYAAGARRVNSREIVLLCRRVYEELQHESGN